MIMTQNVQIWIGALLIATVGLMASLSIINVANGKHINIASSFDASLIQEPVQ